MGIEGQPRQPWDPAPAQPPPSAVDPEISRRISAILDSAEREVAEIRRQAREEALRYMDYARRRADGLVAEQQARISELSGTLLTRAEHLLAQVESAQPLREALDDLVHKLTETAEGLTREAANLGDFVPPEFGEAAAETPPEPAPGPTPVPDPAPTPEPPAPTPIPEPQAPPPAAAAPPRASAPPAPLAWPQVVQPAESSPRPPEAAPEPTGPATERRHAGERGADSARVAAIQMAASGSTRAEVGLHIRETVGVPDPAPILDEVFGPGTAPEATVRWARRV